MFEGCDALTVFCVERSPVGDYVAAQNVKHEYVSDTSIGNDQNGPNALLFVLIMVLIVVIIAGIIVLNIYLKKKRIRQNTLKKEN